MVNEVLHFLSNFDRWNYWVDFFDQAPFQCIWVAGMSRVKALLTYYKANSRVDGKPVMVGEVGMLGRDRIEFDLFEEECEVVSFSMPAKDEKRN